MNALLSLPFLRVTRTPRAWIPVGAWSLFAIGAAILLHRASPPSNAGDALDSVFGPLALPFLAYAVVGAALGGDGLARSSLPLVSFGASPARAAMASIVVAAVATAVLAAVLGVLVAGIAHAPSDPPLARDALTTAWVAALGGAAYASLFAFGASFGKRGGGRAWILVLDWIFGANDGRSGVVTPRAHVRSLLGGDAVVSWSGHASALMLVVLAIAFGALAVLRARRV